MKRTWWYLIGGIALAAVSWIIFWKRRGVKHARSRISDPDTNEETACIRQHYDKLAPQYDRLMRLFESVFTDGGRAWVASRAQGDVLEIAVGTGRTLPYYPAGTRVTSIDISPEMLKIARDGAERADATILLDIGDAQALSFPDATFDTVTCTLALCTIPDPWRALTEVKRVLRPGGRFLALEHVRSSNLLVRTLQRSLDPVTVQFGGDHLLREPLDDLLPLGFEIEALERSKLGIIERVAARKPT